MTERELPKSLDEAWLEMVEQIEVAARLDTEYRKLVNQKRIEATAKEFRLADDVKAWVESETADKKAERDIADKMVKAISDWMQNERQIMSYKQSKMKAERGLDESHTYK